MGNPQKKWSDTLHVTYVSCSDSDVWIGMPINHLLLKQFATYDLFQRKGQDAYGRGRDKKRCLSNFPTWATDGTPLVLWSTLWDFSVGSLQGCCNLPGPINITLRHTVALSQPYEKQRKRKWAAKCEVNKNTLSNQAFKAKASPALARSSSQGLWFFTPLNELMAYRASSFCCTFTHFFCKFNCKA